MRIMRQYGVRKTVAVLRAKQTDQQQAAHVVVQGRHRHAECRLWRNWPGTNNLGVRWMKHEGGRVLCGKFSRAERQQTKMSRAHCWADRPAQMDFASAMAEEVAAAIAASEALGSCRMGEGQGVLRWALALAKHTQSHECFMAHLHLPGLTAPAQELHAPCQMATSHRAAWGHLPALCTGSCTLPALT